jgi:hypothetical protein
MRANEGERGQFHKTEFTEFTAITTIRHSGTIRHRYPTLSGTIRRYPVQSGSLSGAIRHYPASLSGVTIWRYPVLSGGAIWHYLVLSGITIWRYPALSGAIRVTIQRYPALSCIAIRRQYLALSGAIWRCYLVPLSGVTRRYLVLSGAIWRRYLVQRPLVMRPCERRMEGWRIFSLVTRRIDASAASHRRRANEGERGKRGRTKANKGE